MGSSATDPAKIGNWDRLSVERRAWLVCKDEAARNTRQWFDVVTRVGRAGMGFRTAGHGTDLVNEARADRLAAMQFAAKDLVPNSRTKKLEALRDQRVLPDWFVPEMVRLSKPIERQLRRKYAGS